MAQQTQIKDITITDYTEKSFVVRGDTRPHKETIKTIGGKWNSNLKDGSGWIFPSSKKSVVKEWINTGRYSVGQTKSQNKVTCFGDTDRSIGSLHEKIDKLTKLLQKDDKPRKVNLRKTCTGSEYITIKVRDGEVIDIEKLPTGMGVKVEYLSEDREEDEEDTEPELPIKRLLKRK